MATETPTPQEPGTVRWPDRGQILRQCGILAVVVLAWSGVFYGAMRLPSLDAERGASAEARREARRAAATPDSSPSPVLAEPVPDPAATAPGDGGRPGIEEAPVTATTEVASPEPAPPSPSSPPATPIDRAAAAPPPTADPPTTGPPTTPSPPLDARARGDVPLEQMVLDPLAEADASGEDLGNVSFAADVFPILERRCVKCHGGLRDDGTQRIEEGLSLLTVEAILAGSTWGSVLEPGDVAGSYLYELVEEGDMPDNEPRLLPRELRLIAAWIRAGAPNN